MTPVSFALTNTSGVILPVSFGTQFNKDPDARASLYGVWNGEVGMEAARIVSPSVAHLAELGGRIFSGAVKFMAVTLISSQPAQMTHMEQVGLARGLLWAE